jgi:hypothetical protein
MGLSGLPLNQYHLGSKPVAQPLASWQIFPVGAEFCEWGGCALAGRAEVPRMGERRVVGNPKYMVIICFKKTLRGNRNGSLG